MVQENGSAGGERPQVVEWTAPFHLRTQIVKSICSRQSRGLDAGRTVQTHVIAGRSQQECI